MGQLPLVVLSGGLTALRWMLWLVALGLIVLMIAQKLRNDPDLRPVPEVLAIGAFVIAGYASAWASRKIVEILKFSKT